MSERLTYSIRDLVPHSDLSERPIERDLKLHHVAQAQLRRKYRTFKSEAVISAVIDMNGKEITVNGRLDGYRKTPKGVILYEIKSVPGEPHNWIGSPLLQNARRQLQLYADLARSVDHAPWGNSPILECVLCLVSDNNKLAFESIDPHEIPNLLDRRLIVVLSLSHSRHGWHRNILDLFLSFIEKDSRTDRTAQREAAALLEIARAESRILLSMPPGGGKTRLALRYALRESIARNLPLHWITAKARGRDEVITELERYRAAGIPLRILWKTVPERLCDCSAPGSSCPRRLDTKCALFLDPLSEFRSRSSWSFDDVFEFAQSCGWCPHELSATLEQDADVVIADVNYILNPSRLFARESVLVLDEAQHTAHRVRDNSKVYIRREELLALLHAVPESVRRTIRALLNANADAEDGAQSLREAVQQVSDLTARLPRTPVLASLRRASRLIAELPDDFVLAWNHRGAESALIGIILDIRSTLEGALDSHRWILALSGSLPADEASQRALFPLVGQFHLLEAPPSVRPPVFVVPKLIFKYPLSAEDHSTAVSLLNELRKCYPPTIAVFGQNRASNEVLSLALRVRGHVVLLDEDLGSDWSSASASRPDFLFITIGGSLSESVNPPPDLFSAAAILSPAFHARDDFDLLRSAALSGMLAPEQEGAEDTMPVERTAEAISRVIQAAGRLQRSPHRQKPVFLLNLDFAEPHFLRAWPRSWYAHSPEELVFDSLSDACDHLKVMQHEA
jgi:hypothetical protein